MRGCACSIASVLLLFTIGTGTVAAQQFTGGVRGGVRDANGVVPGVTVTLTNEATSIARETVSNEVGQYNFPAVAPGTYSLTVQLTGYKKFQSTGLVVGTQQFITLDVTLELGALEESITVTGQTPLIETSNASTGGVLDRQARLFAYGFQPGPDHLQFDGIGGSGAGQDAHGATSISRVPCLSMTAEQPSGIQRVVSLESTSAGPLS